VVAHHRLKPGEGLLADVPANSEQVVFIWKGAVSASGSGMKLDAGERDTVLAAGPQKFTIRSTSAQGSIIIMAHSVPAR
jgi:hypothetical protein